MALTFHDASEGMTAQREVLIGEDHLNSFVALPPPMMSRFTPAPIAHSVMKGGSPMACWLDRCIHKLLGCERPGASAIITKLSLDMPKSVLIGETIKCRVAIGRLFEATRSLTLSLSATNAAGEQASRGAAGLPVPGLILKANS